MVALLETQAFFGCMRFKMPLWPALCLGGARGQLTMINAVQKPRWDDAASDIVCGIGLICSQAHSLCPARTPAGMQPGCLSIQNRLTIRSPLIWRQLAQRHADLGVSLSAVITKACSRSLRAANAQAGIAAGLASVPALAQRSWLSIHRALHFTSTVCQCKLRCGMPLSRRLPHACVGGCEPQRLQPRS